MNVSGSRIGESHPRAVLTDHEVDLLLELRAERKSYGWLAVTFEISKSQVARICTGKSRSQVPDAWRPERRAVGSGKGE